MQTYMFPDKVTNKIDTDTEPYNPPMASLSE